MSNYDVVVIGAGAAGLFCAAHAASKGKRVVIVEGNSKPGKKIRISGGGRCNFTNRVVTHRNFLSENPDFARSALSRYVPDDFIALVDRYGIAWHEKTLGQLFCDSSAQQIIDMLVDECKLLGVEIHYHQRVVDVAHDGRFTVTTDDRAYASSMLVVATGGLSIPSLGASDIGYRIARKFGHRVVDTMPALVPLVFEPSEWKHFSAISGVSVECVVNSGSARFRESILFTHKGLSGPAILQISSYSRENSSFSINLLPDVTTDMLVQSFPGEKRHLSTLLKTKLPHRLIDVWPDHRLHEPVNELPRAVTEQILGAMHSWQLIFGQTEGYAKAEVTSGGVDTKHVSSKTMESNLQPGLYFIGEVLDVTGWLGGYNFQWAWSSAYAAGLAIQSKV